MSANKYSDIRDGGFTLVELMISLVVFSIIMVGLYELYSSMQRTWLTEENKAAMQQEARVAMDGMVREMMMMGYGADHKILNANANEIRFEEYILDPVTGTSTTWRIRYYVSGGVLKRETKDLTDTPASTKTTDIISNVDSINFKYFDKDSVDVGYITPNWLQGDAVATSEASPSGVQYLRDQIRRVTVSLVVRSANKFQKIEDGVLVAGDYKYITLTADLSPRNLWEGEVSMNTDPPTFTNASGVEVNAVPWIKVRDTGNCGRIKVQWAKSSASDLAGYLVKYGTSSAGEWSNIKDVPATAADAGNPEVELVTGIEPSPYTAEGVSVISYYVSVQAYDRSYNYSEIGTPVGGYNPATDSTDFATGEQDSTNNVSKPAAPANFQVFDNITGSLKLTWTPSTDTNVVGYRIYRSDTAFPVGAPIPETYVIANETGGTYPLALKGGSSGGPSNTWEYHDGEYIDRGSNLIGCKQYYYAICAVTCDDTRIHGFGDPSKDSLRGGIYQYISAGDTTDQYATGSSMPQDNVIPSPPTIEASPGWQRVFLNVEWPSDVDYDHTRIYFVKGDSVLTPAAIDANLIPDREIYGSADAGWFEDSGSSSTHGIIFNCEDADVPDTYQPSLENNKTYSFLAVAYDRCGNESSHTAAQASTDAFLCGDDPCYAPEWPGGGTVGANVWTTTTNTKTDVSTWTRSDYTNDTGGIMDLGLAWSQIDNKSGLGSDFSGYVVKREGYPAADPPVVDVIENNAWYEKTKTTGLQEGKSYTHRVQATDCIYQNLGPTGTVECLADGLTWTRSDVDVNNITEWSVAPKLENVKPGRFRLFHEDPASRKVNYAYTTGMYHNEVNFFLQNTSLAHLLINGMAFTWGNPSVKLDSVIFYTGDAESTTPEVADGTYTAGVLSGVAFDLLPAKEIDKIAVGDIQFSDYVHVKLIFVNNNVFSNITEFTDMRNDILGWEAKFQNKSMPADEFDATKYLQFTTGSVTTADQDPAPNHRIFRVLAGPSINYVYQNLPSNPTVALSVTTPTLPATLNEVQANLPVTITANVTKPSEETLSQVRVQYWVTSTSVTAPSGAATGLVPMVQSGNNWTYTIPGQEDKYVWFKIFADSAQGTTVRVPLKATQYYLYKVLPFSPCYVTPAAPTSLEHTKTATDMTLTWGATTEYDNGLALAPTDSIVYDIYRKTLGGTFAAFVTGVSATTYTTALTGTTYSYAVKARNSCTDSTLGPKESVLSNEVIVCAGSSCTVQVNPSAVEMDTNWTTGAQTATSVPVNLSVYICDRASDHIWWTANLAAGYDTSKGDHVDNTSSSLSDITMTVKASSRNSGTWPVFHVTLYEIDDTGVFTMTGTSDSVIYITPLTTNYNNLYKNTSPALSEEQKTFPATMKGAPDDTLYFTTDTGIGGCADVQATMTVTTNPCANTPDKPALTYISRSGGNATIKYTRVYYNTDGSPVTSTRDDVTYRLYYAGATETDLNNFAFIDITSSTFALGKYTINISGLATNTDYKFYVKAVDNCSPVRNESAVTSGDVVQVNKNATWGTP